MEQKQKTEDKAQEVSWNLASYLIETMAGIISRSATYCLQSDITNSLSCLVVIRNLISAKLTSEELEGLDKIQYEFAEKSLKVSSADPFAGLTLEQKKQWGIGYLIHRKYNDKLMKLLKKHGYDLPLKKDKSAMGG